MNFEVAKECVHLSDKEELTFPEVVSKLMKAGIESYYADLLGAKRIFYAKNTAYPVDCLEENKYKAGDIFHHDKVIQAIKQIQAGQIKYQEFLKKILEAGVINYMVYISGKKVIYLGRRGEMHIEDFPK